MESHRFAAWLSSDAVVVSFLLLVFSLFALWFFPGLSLSEALDTGAVSASFRRSAASSPPSRGVLGPQRSVKAYGAYTALSLPEVETMERAFSKLNREQRRIAQELKYSEKLSRLREVTAVNARLTASIARLAQGNTLATQPWLALSPPSRLLSVDSSDLARVRECLKHFVRDWSSAGAAERASTYVPIMTVLNRVPEQTRAQMRVLVPGSGLGRLAWEISQLGFDTTANEFSAFMCDAWRFLLDERTTSRTEQHVVHPWAYWWSHQRSTPSLFRGVRFPDVVPRLGEKLHLFEGDFLTLPPPDSGGGSEPGYDYVVTHFFIDTSPNIIATLQQIHALVVGRKGTWINLGPLLWPSNPRPALELSLDEVLDLAGILGFQIEVGEDGRRSRRVECQYTRDEEGMMQWTYLAEFWVAIARRE